MVRAPRERMRAPATLARFSRLAYLTAAGIALELVLLIGLLLPLNISSHPDVIMVPDALAVLLGDAPIGVLRFAIPVLLSFSALAAALFAARTLSGRRAFLVVLGGTLLFSATLVPTNPVGAQDVYHNVADARTLFLHGDNPTLIPPIAHDSDPFYAYVSSWQDTPSAYGPVWYAISALPLPVTGAALWPNVIGQKLITAAFLFGCTLLVMLLAARVRPGMAVAAGILVGWNPLLQFETAGSAHNDVVMAFFALGALYALSRRWWPAVFPLLALSIASKPMLAVIGPVLLVWMLQKRSIPRRQLLLTVVLGGLTLAAMYAPLYAGRDTLAGLQREGEHVTSSPGALVYTLLQSHFNMDWSRLLNMMKLVAWPLFLGGYGMVLWRIRRNADLAALARASAWAVFLMLVLVIWWFMPWYLFWLVPFAALRPTSRVALVAFAFSVCAMLSYVAHNWLLYADPRVFESTAALTAFVVPLLVAVARRPRDRRLPAPELAAAAD